MVVANSDRVRQSTLSDSSDRCEVRVVFLPRTEPFISISLTVVALLGLFGLRIDHVIRFERSSTVECVTPLYCPMHAWCVGEFAKNSIIEDLC
jgi:hypothetical protein